MYNLTQNEAMVKKQLQGKTFDSVYDALFKKNETGNLFFEIKNNQIFERHSKNTKPLFEQISKKTNTKEQFILHGDTLIKQSSLIEKNPADFSTYFHMIYLVNIHQNNYKNLSDNYSYVIFKTSKNGCLILENMGGTCKDLSDKIIGITTPDNYEFIDKTNENNDDNDKKIKELENKTAQYYMQKYDFKVKQK